MVILIVGILSAVVAPQFIDFSLEAKSTVTQQKLLDLKTAIAGDSRAVSQGQYVQPGYEVHMGAPPATLNDLRVQGAQSDFDPYTKKGWRGPYITTTDPDWNLDGWDTTIDYNSGTRTLRSCGADKVCANGDDIVVQF